MTIVVTTYCARALKGAHRIVLCIAASTFLSACVSGTSVRVAETNVLVRNLPKPEKALAVDLQKVHVGQDYYGRVNYAAELAKEYMKMADNAGSAEDFAAIGIISAAGVAAGGLMYGSHLDLIKGAGLAAGTITATRGYFKPGEAAPFLLDAADGMLCIASVARSPQFTPVEAGAPIVDDAISRIRLDLRKKLLRRAPDYQGIINAIKAMTTDNAEKNIAQTLVSSTDVLSDKLNLCVLKAIGGSATAT